MSLPQLEPLPEQLLVGLAQTGDHAAFGVLVTLYERRLLFFLRRFVPELDRAVDLLQDVWLQAYRKLPGLRSPAAFRVWLYQIAHDRAVTQIRRERREDDALTEVATSDEVLDTHEFETAELASLVRSCLDELSVAHRTILTLRFLEGMNLEELADTLRLPLGTIKSRLHHAKLALRQTLKEHGHEDA